MKSISLEEFKGFRPCWLKTAAGARKLEEIGSRKERWTAMDILGLPESEVSAEDKIWAVTKTEIIEEEKLHEFACRCAEDVLKLVKDPDPRSVAAIEAKRKWLKGEITDEELDAARDAAWAAARDAAWAAAWAAARDAAWAAAKAAAWAATRKKQVDILRELIID